ncbi:MAG: PIN domain-containing protein [Candidatus Omnitrophota bacterium]|jgi:predicted nucleic acid-binding protein|nr:MAG: PIN domain-containing protein [Candidatus Omnitrophota bacterium]
MKQIFVDTNAWIALNNRKDQWHCLSIKMNKELLLKGYRYITTNFVLDETYTCLLMKVGHFTAVNFGEGIRSSRLIHVVPITVDIEEEAWKLFKQYTDKHFSFTDCTSFIVMRRLALTKAFTNDHHFEQIGFTIDFSLLG